MPNELERTAHFTELLSCDPSERAKEYEYIEAMDSSVVNTICGYCLKPLKRWPGTKYAPVIFHNCELCTDFFDQPFAKWMKKYRSSITYRRRKRRLGSEAGSKSQRFRQHYFELQDGKCVVCGTETDELELDHVISVAEGGPHTVENTWLLCRPCHKRKGVYTWRFFNGDKKMTVTRLVQWKAEIDPERLKADAIAQNQSLKSE